MRKDMADVIINTVRAGQIIKKYNRLDNQKQDFDSDYWNNQNAPMRKKDKWLSDRLTPLYRYLASNSGKPWDKVWSDICQNNDLRNIRNNHLRDHVLAWVCDNGISKDYPTWRFFAAPFYVKNGILYYKGYTRYKTKKKNKDSYTVKKNNLIYCCTKDGWFKASIKNLYTPTHPLYYLVEIMRGLRKFDQEDYWTFSKPNYTPNKVQSYKPLYLVTNYKQCCKKEIKQILKSLCASNED